MKRLALWFFSLGALALTPLVSTFADAGEDLQRAAQPLAEGVPQVAVVRLRALLATNLPATERRAASAKLGEALVASGEAEEALKVLDTPDLRALSASKFFKAQAFAALNRWAEALPLYQEAVNDTAFPLRSEALFGQAESLRALGRVDQSIAAFRLLERDSNWTTRARLRAVELLVQKEDTEAARRLFEETEATRLADRKERRFLHGRVEAKTSRKKAAELYESILKNPDGAARPVLLATLFAMAEVHLQSRTPEAGDNFLEDFIERRPADPDLPALFAKLDQLYAAQRQQSLHELGRWSRDPAQPRRAFAQWYLARAQVRLGRRDLALETFERLRADHPAVPALAAAFVECAKLAMEDQRFDDAVSVLDTARALRPEPSMLARIEMLAGSSHYRARRFNLAAETFHRIANQDAAYADAALYNTTIAWLAADEAPKAAAASQALKSRDADEQTRGDLRLEEAMIEAARGAKTAADSLQLFVREFPKHPRVSEAWVTLAELAFHAAPPRIDEARQHLARAAENQPTGLAAEHADYLTIWLEDAAATPDETKVIALANAFLQKHATSRFAADVRLKLAETYYRRQDFASAQTQFELLAQQNPGAAVADKARFFAAQSAMQSMSRDSLDRALILFDEVVQKGGELKWAARNEQAAIERRLGKPQDALTFYEEVLRGDAKAPEKREALCAKGDILYELGSADAENYRRAIAAYEQLAAQSDAPPHWRNQALFKKGMCLEKLNEPAEALATFYRIVEDQSSPGRQREFFWYYKAGFNAARLLEQQAQWQPAAAVYEKLAFAGGGRSEEAKSRLNRLRLEHFLWEQ
jgi:outer membrane protein assembly factor BamD (BamD/ComL family)